MKVYFDTEFSDLYEKIKYIKLISAGFVAENGLEFYFEVPSNYKDKDCSNFVLENVLPHLNKLTAINGIDLLMKKSPIMVLPEAVLKLRYFLNSFKEPVQLCCDAPDYDGPILMNFLEKGSWIRPRKLTIESVLTEAVSERVESYFDYQPMAIRHHALWDARALATAVKEVNDKVLKNSI